MMNGKERIAQLVDEKRKLFTDLSDKIWEFAEVRFDLPKSADALCAAFEQEGFAVERGVADMEHAFVATWGSGKPIIGILGEYDALPSLSQEAGATEKTPIIPGGNGHGCGHNALGTGAMAGAVAIRDYMKEAGLSGTIKYFGCPGEEAGSGKAFMGRAGVFDELDAALTWHPGNETTVWGFSSLANYQIYYSFKGVSAHAASAPEHGRSALDAVELMNVGVNYLREHVVQEARVHYAYIDVGGQAPNVVQPTAKVLYFIRAPRATQSKEIFERVTDIARGAALMTGTEMSMQFDSVCMEYIPNDALARAMYENMKLLGEVKHSDEDKAYARALADQFGEEGKAAQLAKCRRWFPGYSEEKLKELAEGGIMEEILPYSFTDQPMSASTDVGDVSWFAPTAQLMAASYPRNVAAHTWQYVACGKGGMLHEALLYAGKAIAMTALDILENPELLQKAKDEHVVRMEDRKYISPIPPEVKPI